MLIKLEKFDVEVKETITRKVAREYKNIMLEGSTINEDNKVALTTGQFDKSREFLVLTLIEKITDRDNPEVVVKPTRDWLDELTNNEYLALEKVVVEIQKDSEEIVKK